MAKRSSNKQPPQTRRKGRAENAEPAPGGLLNRRASRLAERAAKRLDDLGVDLLRLNSGTTILDFGVHAPGGLEAGLTLARIATADLADVSLTQTTLAGRPWPAVAVRTDDPVSACLRSQYAGRKVDLRQPDGSHFFGMCSGPLRAATSDEGLIGRLGGAEDARKCVAVLETRQIPPPNVAAHLAAAGGVAPDHLTLCAAATASVAGTVQIAARGVETALHKLLTLGFDPARVRCGCGTAPLAPAGGEDAVALGRTNDAILYGGRVTLWVDAGRDELADLAPRVPSSASGQHGRPFGDLLNEAGGDFYALDPLLFSPAEVTLIGLRDGSVASAGAVREDLLEGSFFGTAP